MLKISVEFLENVYHGSSGGGEPEWPPHPLRLYKALIAASAADPRLAALERCKPPIVVAPDGVTNKALVTYQQANVGDKPKVTSKSRIFTAKATAVLSPHPYKRTICQFALGDNRTVQYIWPDYDGPDISDLVSSINHVGHGIDRVVAHAEIGEFTLPADAYFPGEGAVYWRVPKSGSLDRLAAKHNGAVNVAELIDYVPYQRGRSVKHAAFSLRMGDALRPFDIGLVPQIASWMRHAALTAARNSQHGDHARPISPAEELVYFAGHVEEHARDKREVPRFYYLPLPSIGHKNVDGFVRKVIVAESRNTPEPGKYSRWLQAHLPGSQLTDTSGTVQATLDVVEPEDKILKYYTGRSDSWVSVTPVVFPSFDRGKEERFIKIIKRMVDDVGLDHELVDFEQSRVYKTPRFPFVPWTWDHRRPYLQNLPMWHLFLKFTKPVYGPLALGSGRFCGLGLMANANMLQGMV